jgi:NAD(P)-dependent dehydrogenase (short-subunit alcohol dehydrogenase family)
LNESLSVNVIATAQVYKYFGQKMGNLNHRNAPYSILATMSSSLGSLTFNKYGGWYAYRAGKAAQHMITNTASLELSIAKNPVAVIGIDPGLVEESIPTGSVVDPDLVMSAGETSVHLWNNVIERVEMEDSGNLFSWDGSMIEC